MSTSSCIRRPLVLRVALFALAVPLQAQDDQEHTRVFSRRYAVHTDAAGTRRLVHLESTQDGRGLALGDWQPAFGPGEPVVLVKGPRHARVRRARVLRPDRRRPAKLLLPADRDLEVGAHSLLLRPRADHGRTTPFELDFLDLAGCALRSNARPDRIVASVAPQAGGPWVVFSLDRLGGQHVHLFDAHGVSLWEVDAPPGVRPAVGVAPSAERAVIGVLDEDDARTSRLSILDSAGRETTASVVPEFRLARFSPDERHVVLLGRFALSLVRISDGALVWSRSSDDPHAPGNAVAFSRDGAELRALRAIVLPDGETAFEVTRYERLVSGPIMSRRTVTEAPQTGRVLALAETASGGWILATRAGVFQLERMLPGGVR